MSDDEEPLDYSNIPDSAPAVSWDNVPLWAMGTNHAKQELSSLLPIHVAPVTKGNLVAQLWLEALSKSNNGNTKVKALATIAVILGYMKVGTEEPVAPEKTDNVTQDEVATVAKAFGETY